MIYNNISQIELELTTKCNASCPQCPRNYYGGKVLNTIPITEWDLDILTNCLKDELKTINHLKLCGTYGDPCVYSKFIEFVEWVIHHSDCKITINTNGDQHSPQWWGQLAKIIGKRGKIYFGLDGLTDTHSIYRRNTDFNRIINNASAFINNEGAAVWSFLIFKHNQHQIDLARKLSQTLGFESFAIKSTGRFINKLHQPIDKFPVYDNDRNLVYYLEPTTDPKYKNTGYDSICSLNETDIHCLSTTNELINIGATGITLPCGWLYDRLYGYEAEHHYQFKYFINLIETSGGFDDINIKNHTLNEITHSEVFSKIEQSWADKTLDRCLYQCGIYSEVVKNANTELLNTWPGIWK